MSTYTKEKTGKNGYEIRADILALAKSAVEHEYEASMEHWELNGGDVSNIPEIPTLASILSVAQEMYSFVEENSKRSSPYERSNDDQVSTDRSDVNSTMYSRQFKKA